MLKQKSKKLEPLDNIDFEAEQNATGFFSLLLKVAKRNPELWKQICNKNNEDNRDTNNYN